MRYSKPRKSAVRSVAPKPVPVPSESHKKHLPPADDPNDLARSPAQGREGNSKRRLPIGMTPRLLPRDAAAAYCGVAAETFDEHIRPHLGPVKIGARPLWDVKALDRWLDVRSGLTDALRPVEDWLAELGDGDTHARG